jgi:hypothetical protein
MTTKLQKRVKAEAIKYYVDKRIKIGRESKLQGWVMSDILEQVAQDCGRNAVPQARKYIVKEVCSIQE